MVEWSIRKERLRNRDTKQLTHHRVWVLRFRGKVVLRSFRWSRCIEYFDAYYRKWPAPDVLLELANGPDLNEGTPT